MQHMCSIHALACLPVLLCTLQLNRLFLLICSIHLHTVSVHMCIDEQLNMAYIMKSIGRQSRIIIALACCQMHSVTLLIMQFQADLEGYPDILLTVTTPPPLDQLLTHSCVQTSDSELHRDTINRKLRFSAPIGKLFNLAHYQCASLSFLPIRGFYQMKVLSFVLSLRHLIIIIIIVCFQGDKVVKLLIQLKLHGSFRNNFDYFEVHIPFINRFVFIL